MKKSVFTLLKIYLWVTAFFVNVHCNAQENLQSKSYDFVFYNNYDLRNSSVNMLSAYRFINDKFNRHVVDNMNPKLGNITRSIFSFSTIFITMVWSHEFGHSLRAKQVGGNFHIHNVALPVPYTTADLPEDISLENEAIFVTAGFEVNYLNIRNLQAQFIRQNGTTNDDLAYAFANRLMYPIYTTFITPIDPEKKEVWIETAGDPVHYILPVFENYSNGAVFLADSTVNPKLVSFYNQATIFATFFQLLDPQFYREFGAAFGRYSKERKPIFLIGDFENGWTYGTLFNASPLGYELYLQNYLHLNGQQYGLYLKYGNPFKNLGLGVSMNDVINQNKFRSDIIVEFWEQDLFGSGISLETLTRYRFTKHLGLSFSVGYKTEGYLLGKQLDAGANVGFGISYFGD